MGLGKFEQWEIESVHERWGCFSFFYFSPVSFVFGWVSSRLTCFCHYISMMRHHLGIVVARLCPLDIKQQTIIIEVM